MSTNTQIIRDALVSLGVLAEGESVSADQAADGLRRLNQMMALWEVDGATLGYFAQTDATATCPIPDWAEKGVAACLAIDLSADYNRPVSPAVGKMAADGYEAILRTLMNQRLRGVDMTQLGSGNSRYNIETDL